MNLATDCRLIQLKADIAFLEVTTVRWVVAGTFQRILDWRGPGRRRNSRGRAWRGNRYGRQSGNNGKESPVVEVRPISGNERRRTMRISLKRCRDFRVILPCNCFDTG